MEVCLANKVHWLVYTSLTFSPETLAMKGLVLNCLEKKKEAYEMVCLSEVHEAIIAHL